MDMQESTYESTKNATSSNDGILTDTLSERAISDEEDLKANIPYFDEINNTFAGQEYKPSLDLNEMDEELVADTKNYQNWNNDPNAMFYASTTPANHNQCSTTAVMSNAYYDELQPEVKYTPPTQPVAPTSNSQNDMLLRPPASFDLYYNNPPVTPRDMLNAPTQHMAVGYATQAHHQQQQQTPSTHMYPHHSAHSSSAAAMHSTAAHASNYAANLWYPHGNFAPTRYYGSYAPMPSQRYSQYHSRYSHDSMMDMMHLSNSGREARNRAEKNRRDKLNGSIQELSTMVPHVAESPRRVDKTAVLRFAAHGMRLQYVFGDTLSQTRPKLTDAFMQLLDSFFLTLTCHGQIVLISSSIEQQLGHCQADLYGQNILHITHPGDHHIMKQQLIPSQLESLFGVMQTDEESGEPKVRSQEEEEQIDKRLREDKRSFTVRLARAGPRSEPTTYELVRIDGSFRRSDGAPRGVKGNDFSPSMHLIRRSRGRDDAMPLHTISGNDIVLIAVARIIKPPKIINRVMEVTNLEYKTRHLIDGRIVDCDQRIGIVAGYMTDEVRNLSPFFFIHQEDVRWVMVALRQMYDHKSSYGESTYRLYTRTGNFIYLQSKGYLEIDKETNKVHSFVCVNTLLDEEVGKRQVQEMKNKFSVIINTQISTSSIDAPASENPKQLEKAVMHLIQNLQNNDDTTDEEAEADEEDDEVDAATDNHHANHVRLAPHHNSNYVRLTRTPPLTLVPPEASSVRSSISKSASVLNVGKNHSQNDKNDVGNTTIAADLPSTCHCDEKAIKCSEQCQQTKSRLLTVGSKRRSSQSVDDKKLLKRRLKNTEIEQVLSSSLDELGRSLKEQLNSAIELKEKGSKYDVPNTSSCLNEILEEHEKQTKMYVDIKTELKHCSNIKENAATKATADLKPNEELKPR